MVVWGHSLNSRQLSTYLTGCFFRYLQLRLAFGWEFPSRITLESDPLSGCWAPVCWLNLYPLSPCVCPWPMLLKRVWYIKDGKLTFLLWRRMIGRTAWALISLPWSQLETRFIQLNFLHRVYYTPHCLTTIYPSVSLACPWCQALEALFFHMVWSCPSLQSFWTQVVSDVNSVCGLTLGLDPKVLLLNVFDDSHMTRYIKLFICYTSFYACREILLYWKYPQPPTVTSWHSAVNKVLPLHKLTYLDQKCPRKFDKIWSAWIDSWGVEADWWP